MYLSEHCSAVISLSPKYRNVKCPSNAILRTTQRLLERQINYLRNICISWSPILVFANEQLAATGYELVSRVINDVLYYENITESVENIVDLLYRLLNIDAVADGEALSKSVCHYISALTEVAQSIEERTERKRKPWERLSDTIMEQISYAKLRCFVDRSSFQSCHIPALADFSTQKLLGFGGFGVVYLVKYKQWPLAFKIRLKRKSDKPFIVERAVAALTGEQVITGYLLCFCTAEAHISVMEFIDGVNLVDILPHRQLFKSDVVVLILIQLIKAIMYLHVNGFVHRDIKPINIMITKEAHVKLIDFDTSRLCQGYFIPFKKKLPTFFLRTCLEFFDGDIAGGIPFSAPEVLERKAYGRAVDWWSLGATGFSILNGSLPFKGPGKPMMLYNIINSPVDWGVHTKFRPDCHLRNFIDSLLQKNPSSRLGSKSYAEIISHPAIEKLYSDDNALIGEQLFSKLSSVLPCGAEDDDVITMQPDKLPKIIDLKDASRHYAINTFVSKAWKEARIQDSEQSFKPRSELTAHQANSLNSMDRVANRSCVVQ